MSILKILNMKRCTACGRIPFYCNCDKEPPVVAEEETLGIEIEIKSLDEIEKILEDKNCIGYANFSQTEYNGDGIVHKKWANYWYSKKEGYLGSGQSDQIKYDSKIEAMNGIVKAIRNFR